MQYLAAAFIAVWLLATLYLVFISFRQRRLEQELAALEETLSQRKVDTAAHDSADAEPKM